MSHQIQNLVTNNSMQPIIDREDLAQRVQRLTDTDLPRLQRLWNYYRNPILPAPMQISADDISSNRPYRQAQEWGIPARITGTAAPGATSAALTGVARKEVVVENDIGWRIDTIVDYLFGKQLIVNSSASDSDRRAIIERLLRLILAHNGGIVFLQQLALMGAVYGFVDVLVKFDAEAATNIAGADLQSLGEPPQTNHPSVDELPSEQASDSADAPVPPTAESASRPANSADDPPPASAVDAELARIARCIRLELVEPTRALPFLDSNDYRNVLAYGQVYSMPAPRDAKKSSSQSRRWLERIFPSLANAASDARRLNDQVNVVELITTTQWQRFENGAPVAQGENSLGELPLVHIQNSAIPFEYAGGSDVEPLLPLQDELNTRLSDRAQRITMQSFKMYLGKGIDNFGELPVAPGRMWMTENENATIQEFGGDAASPSEESHIKEVREALDKTSSVTPIAAGAIKGRIGQLSSAAALRVTMAALIAKTERKRTLYGGGIKRMCELSLAWLDRAGLFRTSADERRVELSWPSSSPNEESDRLADAQTKLRLGVPRDVVLRELGYTPG